MLPEKRKQAMLNTGSGKTLYDLIPSSNGHENNIKSFESSWFALVNLWLQKLWRIFWTQTSLHFTSKRKPTAVMLGLQNPHLRLSFSTGTHQPKETLHPLLWMQCLSKAAADKLLKSVCCLLQCTPQSQVCQDGLSLTCVSLVNGKANCSAEQFPRSNTLRTG